MNPSRKGIFGGSFDPPHLAHVRLAQTFLESGQIDELVIMPTFHPPHKSPTLFSFEDRMYFCRQVFNHPKIEVSDLESHLSPPSFTVQTLNYLKKENPSTQWVLCIGGDSWKQLHTWKEAEKLITLASILIAERPGIDLQQKHLSNTKVEVHFCTYTPLPFSSTLIREELKQGRIPSEVPSEIHDLLKVHPLVNSR